MADTFSILDLNIKERDPDGIAPFYQDLNLTHIIDKLAKRWGKKVKDYYRYLPETKEEVDYRRAVFSDIKKDAVYKALMKYTERLIEVDEFFVLTGPNQGGKSTFLRSIGIAQVMMQCGLPVTAASFKSGIFPRIFVHFTRREDSEMNSGRLDEELGRMSMIRHEPELTSFGLDLFEVFLSKR